MDASGRQRREDRPTSTSGSPRLEAVIDVLGGVGGRTIRVWKALPSERRLAALAAVGLFVTLFLPWYQETVFARGVTRLQSVSTTMSGWGAFSFVEAAVLLVSAAVLLLLFIRAEGQAFHVPGGDGTVVTAAGVWTCVLIVWRIFDKEGTTGHGLYSVTVGIEWGIFAALAVAALLTYAGTRIRLAHEPEPPLPGERPARRSRRRDARRDQPRPEARRSTAEPGTRSRPTARREHHEPVAEFDIEQTWLELEDDRERRGPPPPPLRIAPAKPAQDTTATDPPQDRTAIVEDATEPTEPVAASTEPLAPPTAAPVPRRRRRPRSLAEPAGDDSITVRREPSAPGDGVSRRA